MAQHLRFFRSGTVSESGSISRSFDVGGLVGYNVGSISNSFAFTEVNGNFNIDKLVGWNSGTISFSESFTISSPEDILSEIDKFIELSWTVSGSGGTYTLFKDNEIVDTGFWVSNMQVTISLFIHTAGTYTYTILVIDYSGLSSDRYLLR